MLDLLGAEGNVIDADLCAVFKSPEDLKSEDRLLYESLLIDSGDPDERLTEAAHIWCGALMQAGKVVTFQEALFWLREKSQDLQIKAAVYDAPVWSVDLTNKRPRGNVALRKLQAFADKKRGSGYYHYDQRLGIATHAFISRMHMGDFAPSDSQQMELFDEQHAAFLNLQLYSFSVLRDSLALKPHIPAGAIVGPGICDQSYLEDLEAIRKEAGRAIRTANYWHEQYVAGRPFLLPLAGMLAAIEYPLIAEFTATDNEWQLHLTLLTMLNWARILRVSQKRRGLKPVYITEVPVICRRSDGVAINIGRLDCVEIAEINGKRPTRAQYGVLSRIRKTYEYGFRPKGFSTGTVCFACIAAFGPGARITFRFRDWKISVGDTPDRRKFRDTFSVKDVANAPFTQHARQIIRYDCSVRNDQGMAIVGAYAGSDTLVLFEDGIVDYQCHDGAREHAVTVDSTERSAVYARIMEQAQGRAGLRAQVRAFSNDMSNCIWGMVGEGLFRS